MLLLIHRGNLLILGSHDLESLSTFQEDSVLYYHLILELLDVLQFFLLLLFLYNPPPFGLFLYFGLHLSPGLLSCMFYMMGLYCLLQSNQKPLLFLVISLYFTMLLFKHIDVVLRNIGEGRGRHDDIRKAKKFFFSAYVLLT